jgi:hypothetical protein
LAYGSGIPYLPVVDLLRDHCGIAAGDGLEMLTGKLQLALKCCREDLEAELSLLLDLLSVPVETDRFAGLALMGAAPARLRPYIGCFSPVVDSSLSSWR